VYSGERLSSRGLVFRRFFIFCLLILAGSSYCLGQSGSDSSIVIELGRSYDGLPGHNLAVQVIKSAGREGLLSFDLRIGFDARALTLYGVTPGPLFDIPGSFEWEYWRYRIDVPFVDNSVSIRTVRVTGIADLEGDSHQPLVPGVPDGTILFYLNFWITMSDRYECCFSPVDFYWTDCTDNVVRLADSSGSILAISREIYDWRGNNITNISGDFPTISGAPDECLEPGNPGGPVRSADFRQGGVDIACFGKSYAAGDINLNDMPFDIGDAIIFTNYFHYGLSAFTINIEAQIAQTDVNADGVPLSYDDFVYLLRVIELIFFPFY
jgi:hypothetical protein